MAQLYATSLFAPNNLPSGGTYINAWQDYANDNGSVSSEIYRVPGTAWVSGVNAGTWAKSARSVATVSGIFSVVLRGQKAMFAYLGLNNEAVVSYPGTRYARAMYAFVSNFTGPGTAQVSRPNELGVVKGSSRTWSASESALAVAICDTGTEIVYKVSGDNGATWTLHYTSVAAYVPNDVYRIDVGSIFANQALVVEVYPSVV